MTEARRFATLDDVLRLPDNVVGEIVAGELYTSPRPTPRHALAESSVISSLFSSFGRRRGGVPGGWWILGEPELHLEGHVLVPDVAGWRRARMPALPEGAVLTLVPDWLCEVLSPSTSRLDRYQKLPVYARLGVPFVWLVDPLARAVEVYRSEGETWRVSTHIGDSPFRAEPFEAVELDPSEWWADEPE